MRIFEGCALEWHLDTVSGYLDGLNASSLSLSRAVERFGIPLYGFIPRSLEEHKLEKQDSMNLSQLNGSLQGITTFGAALVPQVKTCLARRRKGISTKTRKGEPYLPELFKFSSNFAEHVSKLIVSFRDITPSSIHDLTELALHLDSDDPYRDRIADLKGATADGNIAMFADPSRPPEKIQDEPVSCSIKRSVASIQLLRDFLVDRGSDFAVEHESDETISDLDDFIETWRRVVEKELSAAFAENPSEKWVGSMARDASAISCLLRDLYERSQPQRV